MFNATHFDGNNLPGEPPPIMHPMGVNSHTRSTATIPFKAMVRLAAIRVDLLLMIGWYRSQ